MATELLLRDEGTVGVELIEAHQPPSETLPAVSKLVEGIGLLRSHTRFMHEDVTELHHKGVFVEWDDLSGQLGRAGASTMLDELADLGFSWRDLARLIGVSVPAIQKWRRGEGVTGGNRRKIAGLLAAMRMISHNGGIEDVASWMEMPLRAGVPVTPMDVWTAARVDLLFDYAISQIEAEDVLTALDPDWRERFRSEFEVFKAGDGQLSIRMKER